MVWSTLRTTDRQRMILWKTYSSIVVVTPHSSKIFFFNWSNWTLVICLSVRRVTNWTSFSIHLKPPPLSFEGFFLLSPVLVSADFLPLPTFSEFFVFFEFVFKEAEVLFCVGGGAFSLAGFKVFLFFLEVAVILLDGEVDRDVLVLVRFTGVLSATNISSQVVATTLCFSPRYGRIFPNRNCVTSVAVVKQCTLPGA